MDMREYIDTLLSACIPYDTSPEETRLSKNNYMKISSAINEDLLRGEQFILFKIISRSYDNNTRLSWKYVEILAKKNIRRFIRDQQVAIKDIFPSVKASDLQNLEKEQQVANALMENLKTLYNSYQSRNVELEELNTSLDLLKEYLHEEELKRVLLNVNEILFSGKEVSINGTSQFLTGLDAEKYILGEVSRITNKYANGTDELSEITLDSYEAYKYLETNSKKSYDFVTDTGLEPFDKATGGMFTTQVWGLAGMSGVGKSRFLFKLIYRALILYCKNVYFYGREQHCVECETYLATQHVWSMYGTYIDDKTLKLHSNYLRKLENGETVTTPPPISDEDLQLIEQARLDLYSNPNYGTIHLDNTFTPVEKLDKKIKTYNDTIMKVDFVGIDHMSILPSDGSLNNGVIWMQTPIVSHGMKALKNLAQSINCLVIAVNQLTREQVEKLLSGKTATIGGGANSSEYEHTCDGLAILGTTEELDKVGQVTLDNAKARDSEKISRLILNTSKGICQYEIAT